MKKEQEILEQRIEASKNRAAKSLDEMLACATITELRAVTNKEETKLLSYSFITSGNPFVKEVKPKVDLKNPEFNKITIIDLISLETQGVVTTKRWINQYGDKVISYKPKKFTFFKKNPKAIEKRDSIFKTLIFNNAEVTFTRSSESSLGIYYQREIVFDDKFVNYRSSYDGPLLDVTFYVYALNTLEAMEDSIRHFHTYDGKKTIDVFKF